MGCYAQLTQEQRYQIHGLMKAGYCQSEIAMKIEVHKSTVSREIRRNSGQRGYRPAQAHGLAGERREAAVTKRISDEEWEMISRLIRFDLSPEQAAATVYQEQGICISPEWIYRFIYADKAGGGDLHEHFFPYTTYRLGGTVWGTVERRHPRLRMRIS